MITFHPLKTSSVFRMIISIRLFFIHILNLHFPMIIITGFLFVLHLEVLFAILSELIHYGTFVHYVLALIDLYYLTKICFLLLIIIDLFQDLIFVLPFRSHKHLICFSSKQVPLITT